MAFYWEFAGFLVNELASGLAKKGDFWVLFVNRFVHQIRIIRVSTLHGARYVSMAVYTQHNVRPRWLHCCAASNQTVAVDMRACCSKRRFKIVEMENIRRLGWSNKILWSSELYECRATAPNKGPRRVNRKS